MNKTLATAILHSAFFISCAPALAGYVQAIPADVADSRQNFPLRVARGEVVDLSIDFFDDGEPLDITGAAVTLHTRTNGMDAAESWQTAGTATNNSALFILDVDAVLPLAAGQWSCVASRDGRTLARVGGPAYVRGTAAAQSAALPQNALAGYATTNWTAAAIESAVAAIPAPVESDPIFAEWADANTNRLGYVSHVEEAETARFADYAEQAGSADEAQTAGTATYADSSAFATNAADAQHAWNAETASTLLVGFSARDGEFFTERDAAVAQAATNYTDAAIAAIDIPDPDLSFTNDFIRAESDPVWSEWVAARTNEAGWFYAETAGTAYEAQEAINAGKLGGNESSFFARASDLAAAASAATNYTDGAVAALDYATPTDVATEVTAASNALARAWSADSVLLSSMLLGSNVVAEVTNYNSKVRSPTLRLLQLNESNEYFQVWAETNNLSRVARAATNHADAVSAAAYVAATNFAAPRAWSGTTSGLGADAPEGWTWISTPQMAIAGGFEYEKNITSGGAIWILKSNGMAANFHSVSNNTAYLDISATDGSSLFRIEKTDSFLVGVDTTSVNVSGDALICGVNCVSATHPLVRVRQSLTQGDWSREEDGIPANLATVEWSGESGAWVCEITNTSGGHSMFATMEMLQEGGAKLVNAASLDVSSSGILCTDGVHKVRPVYNNGSITWEVFQ